MRKPRNYKAEYARRNFLAQSRGHKNYAAYRRAYETGKAPAIAPSRLKTKRSLDAQQNWITSSFMPPVNILEARIEIAQAWSDKYGRSTETKFSEDQARQDPEYLRLYLNAFVYAPPRTKFYRRLTPSPALEQFFVGYMHIYQADEYESRYGEDWPHGGDYNRKRREERRRIERKRNSRRAYRKRKTT